MTNKPKRITLDDAPEMAKIGRLPIIWKTENPIAIALSHNSQKLFLDMKMCFKVTKTHMVLRALVALKHDVKEFPKLAHIIRLYLSFVKCARF